LIGSAGPRAVQIKGIRTAGHYKEWAEQQRS